MALHQLFTLAFALHLEPLPTLDYATVPYVRDPAQSAEALDAAEKLRVGANAKLEPIHTRHLPHSVDTLSFILNHTRAIDAVEPFSKLIGLLDEADDDPEFRNLREFFDARYGEDRTLIGAEKEPQPHRRMRSISRAASTKQSARRPSHATEGRKSSFANSLGGGSALKLNWLRRNNNTDSHNHEASDDEDSHSRVSSSGHASSNAPPCAPYIRLSKRQASSSPASSASSSSNHRSGNNETTNLVTFPIRLDLHTVGLAPAPLKVRTHRQADANNLGLQRTSSGRSTTSSDWKRRRARNSSLSNGGGALRRIASPDSMASFGAVSTAAIGDYGDHSGFQRLAIDTNVTATATESHSSSKARLTPSTEAPNLGAGLDTNLPSITEGSISSPAQPTSPRENSSALSPQQTTSPSGTSKPTRRSSMMSKLLDFGRKKSFLDRPGSEAHDSSSTSPAPSHGDDTSELRSPATAHRSSFRSGLGQRFGQVTPSNEEALDLEEDDEDGAVRAQMMRQAYNEGSTQSRRRSSAGSSGHHNASSKSNHHDLRPVQEDGLLDLTTIPTRSSVATSLSDHGVLEDSLGGQPSAAGASRPSARPLPAAVKEGQDFLSLFRAASSIGLKSIGDGLDEEEPKADSTNFGDSGDVTTPGQESVRSLTSDGIQVAGTGSTSTPLVRTPQVKPQRTSLPATPGRSIRSLDLDRSPNPPLSGSNPIDASFKLGAALGQKNGGDEEEAWWPCGEVDPLPISLASALGQALGWEGIMHLCYGRGSRAAEEGSYVALGKAAAQEQAEKVHERSVLAWRTGVASAGTSPPKAADNLPSLHELGPSDTAILAGSLTQKLNLDPATPMPDATSNSSLLERLQDKAPPRSSTLPKASEMPSNAQGQTSETGQEGVGTGWAQTSLLFGSKINQSRTWAHWRALFRSIKGWIDEYEKTRVRSGLAREFGLDRPIDQSTSVGGPDSGDASDIILSAPAHVDAASADMQVPLAIGSPPTLYTEVLKVARDKVDTATLSKVLGTSLSISPCVLADATNRAYGFRRRAGIPEGLPLGPEDEETIDYTWSRKRLSVEHFATALTISCDSTVHFFGQLSTGSWLHRSAWELDYLEMCVFKSPLVADRFPPPGDAVVPASQSYRPAEGSHDRSRLCPNPDEAGAWNPDTWKRWLGSIREGDIIVPAIAWQAWWTLISVLNGADRTGRSYDLQVKTSEEPFEELTDLNAVYL